MKTPENNPYMMQNTALSSILDYQRQHPELDDDSDEASNDAAEGETLPLLRAEIPKKVPKKYVFVFRHDQALQDIREFLVKETGESLSGLIRTLLRREYKRVKKKRKKQ
jgi:hypothetical protein